MGWIDLITGETRLERPELEDSFRQATAAYQVKTHTMVSDPCSGGTVEQGWVDLAANRPGEGLRTRSEQELTPQARGVGADGEAKVGARLDMLKEDGWQVLHSVPVGARGCDIDHVLIGPGGTFTVNTKNHRTADVWVAERRLTVNGHKKSYYAKSHYEAERAARLLSATVGLGVLVRPVLVILCRSFHVKSQPEDVTVLSSMDVPRHFKRMPEVLSSEQIGAVFVHARRSTTWLPRLS